MGHTGITIHATVMIYTVLEMEKKGLSIHHGTFLDFVILGEI
jgi:hypothetical protein